MAVDIELIVIQFPYTPSLVRRLMIRRRSLKPKRVMAPLPESYLHALRRLPKVGLGPSCSLDPEWLEMLINRKKYPRITPAVIRYIYKNQLTFWKGLTPKQRRSKFFDIKDPRKVAKFLYKHMGKRIFLEYV